MPKDPATGDELDRFQLVQEYDQNAALITLLNCWDAGMLVVSLEDFKRLPAPVLDAFRLYQSVKSEIQKPDEPRAS